MGTMHDPFLLGYLHPPTTKVRDRTSTLFAYCDQKNPPKRVSMVENQISGAYSGKFRNEPDIHHFVSANITISNRPEVVQIP